MRIALVGGHFSIHYRRWVAGLTARGHELLQVTLDRHVDQVEPLDASAHVIDTKRLVSPAAPLELRRLNQTIADFDPDLVHAHYASSYGLLLMAIRQRPKVVSVWGTDVFEVPSRSPVHRAVIARALRTADRVLSTSPAMARHVTENVVKLDDIGITPFGIDLDRFSPDPAAETKPDGPAARPFRIGAVRYLYEWYGLDLAIRALAELRAQGVDAELRLAGDGPERETLEALAASTGMADHVAFLGHLEPADVAAELRNLDVAVLPSRAESFGVAALESSACCVPVVAARVGGLADVVIDQTTGILVPPDDVAALTSALADLAGSPDRRRQMGLAGRELVTTQYSWDACLDTMEHEYRRLVASDG